MAEGLSLRVMLADAEVGHLRVDAQQHLQFDYTDDWRQTGFPLSPSVPLSPLADRPVEWRDAAVAYFQNLLPEGQALEDVCRSLQVSRSSTFGLLRAMGREAAGAVRVLEADPVAEVDRVRLIPRTELSERIRDRQDRPFSVWDGTVRLSIAGYQDKLAAFDSGGEWALVEGSNRASTHILKPDPIAPRLAGLTSNEFFCMRLAAAVGLPVAPVRLEHVPEPVLVVERFDRMRAGDEVRRLHVIDACQALGVPPSLKYERPYGDSRDVAAVRTGCQPAAAVRPWALGCGAGGIQAATAALGDLPDPDPELRCPRQELELLLGSAWPADRAGLRPAEHWHLPWGLVPADAGHGRW